MKKKLSKVLTSLALCFAIGGLFTACKDGKPGEPGAQGAVGKSAYELWLAQGNTGSEADFLESLKGVGVASVVVNEEGKLVVTYTNGKTETIEVPGLGGSTTTGCAHENKVVWQKSPVDHIYDDIDGDGEKEVFAGYVVYKCEDCGLGIWEFTEEHVWSEEAERVEATCTVPAYTSRVCTICGMPEAPVYEGEALGHDLVTVTIQDPTKSVCTDGSQEITVCTRCDLDPVVVNKDPIGHKVTEEWTEDAPTATQKGSLKADCDNDDHEVVVELPELTKENYNYVEKFYDKNGNEVAHSCQAVSGKGVYTIYVGADFKATKTADGAVDTYEKEVALTTGKHQIGGEDYSSTKVYNIDVMAEKGVVIHPLTGEGVQDATCTQEGSGYVSCDLCGTSGLLVKTIRNHTLDETKVNVTDPATCTEDGAKEIWCTVEEAYVSEEGNDAFVIPATGHSFAYASFKDAQGTWWAHQTCNNGCGHDELIPLAKEPEVIENATCQKEGKLLLTYVVDEEEKTLEATIGKTNHKLPNGELHVDDTVYNLDKVDYIQELTGDGIAAATCKDDGKGFFICAYADCDENVMVTTTRDHEVDESKGYEYDRTHESCTVAPIRKVWCTVEKAWVVDKTQPEAKGHEFEYAVRSSETAGKVIVVETCKNCDYHEEYEVDDNPVVTPASCQKAGNKAYTYQPASGPAVTINVPIAKTAHMLPNGKLQESTVYNLDEVDFITELTGDDLAPATCKVKGKGYFVCQYDDCGEHVMVTTTRNHSYDTVSDELAPTCTTAGYKKYTCTECGNEITENIAATGHTLSYEVTVLPTAETTGTVVFTCSKADCLETVATIELKAISAANGYTTVEEKAPTCINIGKYEYTVKVTVEYASEKVVENVVTPYTASEEVVVTVKWAVPATGIHDFEGSLLYEVSKEAVKYDIDGDGDEDDCYFIRYGMLCSDENGCGKMIIVNTEYVEA